VNDHLDAALAWGERAAAKYFATRQRKGQPRVEVHVSRNELAALLAAAFESGRAAAMPDEA
jgi:hypothetical protein